MKRYEDCIRPDRGCGACALSSYGRDCHNQPINKLLWYRSVSGLTQQGLAERAALNIRLIQKYESGEYDIGNMTVRTAKALAGALDIEIKDLMEG